MEEGLVSPHWLVATRITPSFSFSKTNLANNHSESNPKRCLTKIQQITQGRLRLENFPRSASSSIFCMDLLSAFNIARFKFQGSSSNTLEVMSICLNHIGWKNSGRIVRLSLKIWPAMNLNRVQVFWKKSLVAGFWI